MPRHNQEVSLQVRDEGGDQRRAFGQRRDLHELPLGVRMVADRAEPVERPDSEACDEATVGAAAHRRFRQRGQAQLRGEILRAVESSADARRSSGGTLIPRSTRTDVPGVTGRSAASADSTRSTSACVRVLTSTSARASAGTVLTAVPAVDEARCHRRSPLGPGERCDREQLVRELDERVRALLGVETRRVPPVLSRHAVDDDALPLGLQRAVDAGL